MVSQEQTATRVLCKLTGHKWGWPDDDTLRIDPKTRIYCLTCGMSLIDYLSLPDEEL